MNDKCLFFYENECKFLFCSFIIFFFFFDSFILLSWAFVWNDAQAFQIDTLNCFCEVAVIRIVDDRNHNWNLIGTRFKLYYYYTVHCHSVIISKQRFPRPQLVDEALRCLDGSLLRMFFNDCLLCINVNKRIRWLIKKEFFFSKAKPASWHNLLLVLNKVWLFLFLFFFFFFLGVSFFPELFLWNLPLFRFNSNFRNALSDRLVVYNLWEFKYTIEIFFSSHLGGQGQPKENTGLLVERLCSLVHYVFHFSLLSRFSPFCP